MMSVVSGSMLLLHMLIMTSFDFVGLEVLSRQEAAGCLRVQDRDGG
jgi:hypothetical protein